MSHAAEELRQARAFYFSSRPGAHDVRSPSRPSRCFGASHPLGLRAYYTKSMSTASRTAVILHPHGDAATHRSSARQTAPACTRTRSQFHTCFSTSRTGQAGEVVGAVLPAREGFSQQVVYVKCHESFSRRDDAYRGIAIIRDGQRRLETAQSWQPQYRMGALWFAEGMSYGRMGGGSGHLVQNQ